MIFVINLWQHLLRLCVLGRNLFVTVSAIILYMWFAGTMQGLLMGITKISRLTKQAVVLLCICSILVMSLISGCRKGKSVEETERKENAKWGTPQEAGYIDMATAFFLIRFQEPVKGQMAYFLQSAVHNPPSHLEGYHSSKIIGDNQLFEEIEGIPKPIVLLTNCYINLEIPKNDGTLQELSITEVEQLKTELEVRNIEDVKVYYIPTQKLD